MFAKILVAVNLTGMRRHELTEEQWNRLGPLLPPQKPETGRPAKEHRTIINGILWILGTGAPWRDLPEYYGPWSTVACRFYRWRKAGIWAKVLAKLEQDADGVGQKIGCGSFDTTAMGG